MYYLWLTIMVLLLLYTLGYILFWIFAAHQGNAEFVIDKGESDYRIVASDLHSVTLRTTRTLRNKGREQGTVMDCFGRAYMPREYMPGVRVALSVTDADKPREDDYWISVLVPSKTTLTLQIDLTLTATEGSVRDLVEDFPDLDYDIIYQTVGRTDWEYEKTRMTLPGAELRRLYLTKGGHGR